MVIAPNTTIKFVNVPIEIDNKNQINFASKQAQLNYFNSIPNIITITNCTYQRKDGYVRVPCSFDTMQTYNYCFYQNTSHSEKWFFAFVERIEYSSEEMTKVYIKTDVWQTYQFDITFKRCFVEREHVNDDTVGLHTLPENVELGEYICNQHTKDTTMDSYATDLCYIMASTSEPVTGEAKDTIAGSSIYNGIYTGLKYYRYDVKGAIDTILELFANSGKTNAINGVFMAPKWLAPYYPQSEEPGYTYREVYYSNNEASFNTAAPRMNTLNGYNPVNKKLLTFPYCYLLLSNNIGQNAILHYEKFTNQQVCTFAVRGVLNPGCSIHIVPTNYNGSTLSEIDAISLGKFPICNFQNDMYTNWLTQNSINIAGATITSDDINVATSAIGGVAGMITGAVTGNVLGAGLSAVSGAQGIAGAIMQKKQHNMIPPTVNGSLNSADVNVASGNNTFHYYNMSIKQEYAKIIDDFFSMYGYQVNSLKLPNITGRTNWNYVKTLECNIVGSLPESGVEELKEIFNNGVTIWHNPTTFLDYSQSNSIV